MNSKLIAGSVLAGFGTLAAVVNSWAPHFFFAQYHIARGTSLTGAGSFDPGPYGVAPASVRPFIGTRLLIWAVVALGLGLVAWGILSDRRGSEGSLRR